MATWTCPACGRRFGRRGQGHECAPAMALDDYLATGPDFEPAIVRAVLDHLEALGDVIVEPVSVGILVKRSRVFVELRPMARWEALWFVTSRTIEHRRITRRQPATASRTAHNVRLHGPEDVDDEVRDWLTEAWLADG